MQFYIDNTLKDQISGEVDWQPKSYNVSAGIHTLKWRFVKDSSDPEDPDFDNCGWVDYVQWSGPSQEPEQDPAEWQEISYKHDVYGRRSEKEVDGFSTRYVYDGPHVIAEYDGNNNLLRKYIYGPGIDQPVCMIEVADSNAVYYYHFDALGSVVALSDSSGDTVQTYEYSVYGQVAVEDINHPNPYMFAGRRFDIEIGLYYNRARYYNPFTGRFIQTDPIGYGAGMNMYSYCKNNSLNWSDPSGLLSIAFYDGSGEYGWEEKELADDFVYYDYSIRPDDMTAYEFILSILELNKITGFNATEIFIHGHGNPEGGNMILGDKETGDAIWSWGVDQEFEDFWTGIGEFTDPNTVINLRGCGAAAKYEYPGGETILIEEAARLSVRTVTGADGGVAVTIPIWITESWSASGWEGTGPEYEPVFGVGYYRAEVQGDGSIETTLYWKNELVYVGFSFGGYWYNPWGRAPY